MTKKSGRNNMKISVSNYGPIAQAKNIELCPLTVFVGPSNIGKSYLAILIYALLHAFEASQILMPSTYQNTQKRTINRLQLGWLISISLESIDTNIHKQLTELYENEEIHIKFSLWPEQLKQWIEKELSKVASRHFHQELSRCMGAVEHEEHLIKNGFSLHLEDTKKAMSLRASQETSEMKIKRLDSADEHIFKETFRYLSRRQEMSSTYAAEIFLTGIAEELFYYSDYLNHRAESFYLPAARTGIMQSHRAITGSLVQQAASSVKIKNFSTPALSGIVSSFLEEIIHMDTKGPADHNVEKIASEIEKKILRGTIEPESPERNPYPQFLYRQNDLSIPLLRASSMISELAPVVLFIRHRVKKGDLLIIEEPESHLHPEMQRSIAEVMVRLVRAGVRVLVTTHSDYFLEQIGNYVRRSKIPENEQDNLRLEEHEVGAYSFKNSNRSKGAIVKRLKFDPESGLSPEDHDEVSSNLYNETVEILDKIEANS